MTCITFGAMGGSPTTICSLLKHYDELSSRLTRSAKLSPRQREMEFTPPAGDAGSSSTLIGIAGRSPALMPSAPGRTVQQRPRTRPGNGSAAPFGRRASSAGERYPGRLPLEPRRASSAPAWASRLAIPVFATKRRNFPCCDPEVVLYEPARAVAALRLASCPDNAVIVAQLRSV